MRSIEAFVTSNDAFDLRCHNILLFLPRASAIQTSFSLAKNVSSSAHCITSLTGMMVLVQLLVDRCLGYISEISYSFTPWFCPRGRLSISTGREVVNKRTGKQRYTTSGKREWVKPVWWSGSERIDRTIKWGGGTGALGDKCKPRREERF